MADAHNTPECADLSLKTTIKEHIDQILGLAGGNVALAARMLQMSRSTLYCWIERGCKPNFDELGAESEPESTSLPPKIEPSPDLAISHIVRDQERERVICFTCRLVQYWTLSGNCRRCFTRLTREGVIA